jgi:hypothetical protein
MKFAATILSAFVLAIGAEAMRGHVDHEMLMSKAVKVEGRDNLTRKLGDDFQITGDHSIQFSQCLSLTTQPYSSDIFSSGNSGTTKSEKSYVLFDACQTSKCPYASEDNIYMVDLKTYIQATMPYYYRKSSNYCRVCLASEEYCT